MSDVSPPGRWALSALSDTRVEQFWDPDHLVSQRLKADARAPQAEPECCERQGNLWDLAAVYPVGATWTDRLPSAIVFNGPIVDVTSAIETAILSRSQHP